MDFSRFTDSNAYKQALAGLLRRGGEVTDFIATAPEKAGQAILEGHEKNKALQAQAFANPNRPFQVTNQQAMGELGDRMLEGPMALAPIGMTRAELIKDGLNQATAYKQLQEANKSTYPKIPVANVFKNPQGKLPEGKIKSFDDIIEKQLDLPIKEIDINAIVPTQKNINFDNLKSVKNVKDAKDSILAVMHEGKYYLIDGHHRVANDILKNKDKIAVKVFE
jgi:hypothetical protein